MMDYSCSISPHYSVSSSASVVSSEASSGAESGRSHVRTLRLARRGNLGTFGFSVRGGREHGTGFFVSAVEEGSEAHCQGLRVGDQIMRVNGFPVDNAVHKEILHLVQRQTHINLKVRTVGMIPVKDKSNDPLTWRLVEEEALLKQGGNHNQVEDNRTNISSVKIGSSEYEFKDVRIYLEVAAKTKLGCGICKGPDWKPGIFIQYTKENGVAREAGLRPGDQILQCNGVPFLQTAFNDAVEVLKSARQLDLVIRKGAGLELFPGESSGYNSSASSVNGDMSPSWGDVKRLSIVKEEAMSEGDERLIQTANQANQFLGKHWAHSTKCENNGNDYIIDNLECNGSEGKPLNRPTVIHIRDAGRTGSENDLYNSSTKHNGKLAEICMISQQQETTTVIVEVHRSDMDENGVSRACNGNHHGQLSKSLSSNSFASASSTSSLGSALSQELHRRTNRQETDSAREQRRKTLLKTIDKEEEERHQKLMTEFKLAHRRMFKSTDNLFEHHVTVEADQTTRKERDPTPVRHQIRTSKESPVQTLHKKEQDREVTCLVSRPTAPPPPPMPPDSASTSSLDNSTPPSCPTPDYDTSSLLSESSLTKTVHSNGNNTSTSMVLPSNSSKNGVTNTYSKPNSKNIPFKVNDLSKNPKVLPSEPPTKKLEVNVNKTTAIISSEGKPSQLRREKKVCDTDRVEMISIESFTLNNPSSPKPKPPPTYFGSNSAEVSSKKPKPVAVTIGEYQSGVDRRRPVRFEFLSNPQSEDKLATGEAGNQIGSLLQTELAQTLSRSNLRKQTEPQVNDFKGNHKGLAATKGVTTCFKSLADSNHRQHFSKTSTSPAYSSCIQAIKNLSPSQNQYNTSVITHSTNPCVKTTSEQISGSVANNRITIRVPDSNGNASETLNGILKNGTGTSLTEHRSVFQQKSISFGEITTVINDVPPSH